MVCLEHGERITFLPGMKLRFPVFFEVSIVYYFLRQYDLDKSVVEGFEKDEHVVLDHERLLICLLLSLNV